MIKSKNLLIKQGIVSGVKHRSKMTDAGVRLNAGMNLKAIKRKRRIEMDTTNNFDPSARLAIKEFEAWQRKVFTKNARKGYHFFQPDNIGSPTPRSAREAWGGVYRPDLALKNEKRNEKIMLIIVTVILIGLSIL